MCARVPAMSYAARRQSKWTERLSATNASEGPPSKRLPQSAFEPEFDDAFIMSILLAGKFWNFRPARQAKPSMLFEREGGSLLHPKLPSVVRLELRQQLHSHGKQAGSA